MSGGEVCFESMMEMDIQLRVLSKCEIVEAVPCMKEEAKEEYNDSVMRQCDQVEVMDVCNDPELGTCTERLEAEDVLDNMQLDSSASSMTDEVLNNESLSRSENNVDIVDNADVGPCSETQVKEVESLDEIVSCSVCNENKIMNSADLKPSAESHGNESVDGHCHKMLTKKAPKESVQKEMMNEAEVKNADKELLLKEVINYSELESRSVNHKMEVMNKCYSELFTSSNGVKEAARALGLETCPKNILKEASNDDIYSEVSNPNVSPKHVTSTLSSQEVDVHDIDHGGCGEINSAYCQNSSSGGSLSEEEHHQDHKTEPAVTSCVVLEIPKHISTTGVTKITFKFSKRKEDYSSKKAVAVEPSADSIHEEYHDNPVSVSASYPLAGNGFHNYEGESYENAEMNLGIDGGALNGAHCPLSCFRNKELKMLKANLQYGTGVAYADGVHHGKHCGVYASNISYPIHPIENVLYPAPLQYSRFTPYNQQSYMEAPVEQMRLTKKPRHHFSTSVWEKKKSGTKKRDNDLHKLLFMPNGLPDGTDLAYYAKGKKILGGYKQRNGIICSCCNTEISPSQFEAHAGWSAKRQPYRHIYTSSGLALHDVALMLANGQNLITSGHDDMCAVCGDGRELILCNGCPRAFHSACLGLQCLPANDWHCPHCNDKFGPGIKPSGELRPIIVRFTRVVKAPEFEPGGCVVCRSQEFSAANFDDKTVIICDQCEKEYHVGCLRESGMCDLKELPDDKWFCCDACNKIFTALQTLASSGPEVIPTSASSALYKKQPEAVLSDKSNNEIQWCILSGKSRSPEHLFLLSRAAEVFRECFDPIVAASGRDLIPVMVYGRNISGQEFSGMHCVVLTVKNIVVSAALLRIFGSEAAELPLVATSRKYQGKGYFGALFSCIERFLLSMDVKHLVLPAAEEAEPMWTKKLGFRKTSIELMRDLQLTIFKGTSLLLKELRHIAE